MTHVAKNHLLTFRATAQQVWRRRSREIVALILGSIVLFAVAMFIELASEVREGELVAWDEGVLKSLRRADDPRLTVGPHWLFEGAMDITALGSPVVLSFFVLASSGFLYFEGQKRVALMAMLSTGGGALLSVVLKEIFLRPRPSIVPHLREVGSSSFPSGHTMGAAVVFLTLGVMFMKSFKSRRAKIYVLFWAVLLTALVGVSRVFLGVHYPSDVLGGWIAGAAWALACHGIGRFVPNHPMYESNDEPRPRTDL